MPNNSNMYKFEIIEKIIKSIDFTTKEEVVQLAKKMMDIAEKNKNYSTDIKDAFKEAYNELNADDLTVENLNEIKAMLN